MVSTHLKNISQIGWIPQARLNKKRLHSSESRWRNYHSQKVDLGYGAKINQDYWELCHRSFPGGIYMAHILHTIFRHPIFFT